MARLRALAPTSLSTFATGCSALLRGHALVGLCFCNVQPAMLGLADRYQVLRPVVVLDAVDVVNVFPRLKAAAIRLFPHKSMFTHVTALIREMVSGVVNKDVTGASSLPSTLPLTSLRPGTTRRMALDVPSLLSPVDGGVLPTTASTKQRFGAGSCEVRFRSGMSRLEVMTPNVLPLVARVVRVDSELLPTTTSTGSLHSAPPDGIVPNRFGGDTP